MIKQTNRNKARVKRHQRIRARVIGSTNRPRLCVYRSNKHIYVQIVDDTNACTLVAASTLDKDFNEDKSWDCNSAEMIGKNIAKKALAKGIQEVVFDRGGYLYHGRIAKVADGARNGGLTF